MWFKSKLTSEVGCFDLFVTLQHPTFVDLVLVPCLNATQMRLRSIIDSKWSKTRRGLARRPHLYIRSPSSRPRRHQPSARHTTLQAPGAGTNYEMDALGARISNLSLGPASWSGPIELSGNNVDLTIGRYQSRSISVVQVCGIYSTLPTVPYSIDIGLTGTDDQPESVYASS